MQQTLVVNNTADECRIALLEQSVLQEIQIERSSRPSLTGNIYKGRVIRLMPAIKAAFIDIGLSRAGFLHVDDVTHEKGTAEITDLLKPGQKLLVEVKKDALSNKGVRLTCHLSLSTRHLVFTPGKQQITVSQRIPDDAERLRLISIIGADQAGGFIIRTAAAGIDPIKLMGEKEYLIRQWQVMVEHCQSVKAPACLYQELPLVMRLLRDMAVDAIEKVIVDNRATLLALHHFANESIPSLIAKIEFYQDISPIFDFYGIEVQLQQALQSKIHLKCGGYLLFDQTEAMTTIDVNTGSARSFRNAKDIILTANLEAAAKIAEQIRLRNLGGIIAIDFIDMDDAKHKELLLQALSQALAKDPAKITIGEVSSLGLVELTRKRSKLSLKELLCVPCPLCQGQGVVKSIDTICYEIIRELRRIAHFAPWPGFLIVANSTVIEKLAKLAPAWINETGRLGKPIKLQVEDSYKEEQYHILPLPPE